MHERQAARYAIIVKYTGKCSVIVIAAPVIVIAAPVINNNGVSAISDVFGRDATCNPVFSSDPRIRAEQKATEQRMKVLTGEYKAVEKKCPSDALTKFGKKGGDKNAKEALKQKCIDGYTACAQKRELANKACIAADRQIDAGHKGAVTFCRTKAAEWRARKVQ
ncbi:uncharacterized protein M421DRAFT_412726 [Didymella exigua CBS 183.55]|uniref:Novel toxin 16 domain-containing protein n=1 Tax=Didymella exigua CBS 183.55 TaxID=1150837 RepID=A0A6A5RQ66_9PLEO|nr:uncharacterized protein M421DRAFT_412726 [Didymella exigua CBS 183.55]KAF1930475.1 hypothetical protein M421DRAFT_412726 [Didymella exigua CBS 183.55]